MRLGRCDGVCGMNRSALLVTKRCGHDTSTIVDFFLGRGVCALQVEARPGIVWKFVDVMLKTLITCVNVTVKVY